MSTASTAHVIAPAAPTAGLPTVDGKYELVRSMWTGRSCEVFDAREIATRRAFVVKVARGDGDHAAAGRAGIRRESRALALVQNDNVLGCYDAGECAERGPYVVTERLIGRNLDGLLASRGKLGPSFAIHVLREMALALSEVHRNGFVHGDVKPGNVFVAQARDGGERLKLLDFASAMPLQAPGPRGRVAPSPAAASAYAAPELVAGTSGGDERSDLYALGLVALECLGVRPNEMAWRFGTHGLASTVLQGKPDLPGDVLPLLDELLTTDPHARPESAGMVLSRLGPAEGPVPRLLLGYVTKPTPPPGGVPVWLPAARSRSDLRAVTDADRRETPRAPYTTPVRLVHAGGTLDGRSEDIGPNGLMIIIPGDVKELRNPVHVRFALPTTGAMTTVPCAARWFRHTPGHTAIGLELLQVKPDLAAAIATWLAYLGDRR